MAVRKAKAKRANDKKKVRKSSVRKVARERVSKVIHQVKEPFSLLGTLREEGMASAISLLGLASGMASGAAKNLRIESLRPQLKELIQSLGFAFREDLEQLEARVEELEQKISEHEYRNIAEEE